jgi:hypothetical protein
MGLKDSLLGLDDLRTKDVEVPAWKTTVTIRELGLQESMNAFGSLKPDKGGKVTLEPEDIAKIVAYGVIDPETGDRVFSDEDVPKLARKNTKALMLLYGAITSLSGSVEDEVKN